MKRLVGILILLICSTIFGACDNMLHAKINGQCVYTTDATGNTQELFCVEGNDKIYGIASHKRSIYLAVNRGEEITIQKRTMKGSLQDTFILESLGGQYASFFDLAMDKTGLWAVNSTIVHYNLQTLEIDNQLAFPDGYGYYNAYGVAYNYLEDLIYVLVIDESGLDRDCPAIATYRPNGELIDLLDLPVDCLATVFGLGYDPLSKSFWLSGSFMTPDPDVLLNVSQEDGTLIQTIPIDHQFGSVECYAGK